jgi:dTDP-4-amino-4,6-dideoxygalactose transaminase
MRRIIPHSQPYIGQEEQKAAARVLASGQLAMGAEVGMLERELSRAVRQRHGVGVSSGTAALYLSLRALDVRPGHAVIIPSYVCTALLNVVSLAGAQPVLCDVDPKTGVMSRAYAQKVMGRNVRAIIVPHMFGFPADVADIASLGVPVIEDCAQCVDGEINGRIAGSMGTISVFSFYATKMIAAGEGGMAATSDEKLAQRMRDLREYDNRETWSPSFNFKLSDVHAAIARVQLHKLPDMISRRQAIARRYSELIRRAGAPVEAPSEIPSVSQCWYRYVVRTIFPAEKMLEWMNGRGVACRRPVFRPLHRYLNLHGFPGTEEMYTRAVSLPIYPGLTESDEHYIRGALAAFFSTLRDRAFHPPLPAGVPKPALNAAAGPGKSGRTTHGNQPVSDRFPRRQPGAAPVRRTDAGHNRAQQHAAPVQRGRDVPVAATGRAENRGPAYPIRRRKLPGV